MLKKILRKSVRLPLVRNVIGLSRKVRPPGFEKLSLYEVFAFFFRGVFKGGIQTRAAAMSFSFFLALFPLIIFLFTLIPYVPIDNFGDTLFELMREVLPKNMFDSLQDAIKEITSQTSGGLLSLGFLAAWYFSTNGLVAMMEGFNNSIHVHETRPDWKQQLVATALVLVLSIVIFAGLTLVIFEEYLLTSVIEQQSSERVLIHIGKWLILGALFIAIIAIFYRYGPAKKRHRHFFSPGVLLAAFLCIATSLLFSWYVNNFGRYNAIYGSIGTIMVVLLWIYFNSIMLLIGFELDAGIHSAHAKHRSLLEQEEAEEAAKEAAELEAEKAAREA